MKIEKLNDNQIRCTLTSQDLVSRKIKLSELAYGTEKARMLFHDMMTEANQLFGFNVDNAPLMVEAIPVAPDSIVLIITKVDDPQELDTRFAKFAPSGEEQAQPSGKQDTPQYTGADEILELLQKFHKKATERLNEQNDEDTASSPQGSRTDASSEEKHDSDLPQDLIRCFFFPTLDDVITCARVIGNTFACSNSLYKTEQDSVYLLVLHQKGLEPQNFNKLCNMLSEYAMPEHFASAGEAYLLEHAKMISADRALQNLSVL